MSTAFRLHIDIPIVLQDDVDNPQASAREQANEIIDRIIRQVENQCPYVKQINYRMGCDDDRQASNYLQMNENGHCSNKKSRWIK